MTPDAIAAGGFMSGCTRATWRWLRPFILACAVELPGSRRSCLRNSTCTISAAALEAFRLVLHC
jgi:hypothetical protein